MKRRDFLKSSFLTLAASAGVPGFLGRTAQAASIGKGKILVVVQLSGGNDALNTLVPFTNGAYYNARPTLAVGKKDVLNLNDSVGLNPALKPWMGLWDAGELALVQGVGYPNPNRSHFESMAIWHTADPKARETAGWVGRIAEKYGDPFCATNIGGTTPLALRGADIILPSIASIDRFQFKVAPEAKPAFDAMLSSPLDGRAETLRGATRQMLSDIDRVQKGIGKYKNGATYPEEKFAASLREIARLIAADVGQRVFYTSLGSFDTHAAQPVDHPELLGALSSGLAAFRADLEKQGRADDVVVVGFSEFGRRLAENASAGTDHGKAGLMFALGKGVKGGLYGAQPDLEKLDDGDPVMTTDFRQVYATALDKWLNIPSRDILGASFAPMGFLR
jgi:uncharacterized protein (DUF1501 family)